MHANDLKYRNLTGTVLRGYALAGRTESASFLAWFLENIFRLDDVQAADAICDGPGDRGIDAVYVDQDNSEIVFLQSKVRQREGKEVNTATTRDFGGAIAQFDTPEKVDKAIASDPKSELAHLFKRTKAADRLTEGFAIRGVLVTNSVVSDSARTAADSLEIEIYDRNKIAERYVELDAPERIQGTAALDISDHGCLEYSAGPDVKLYLITVKATDLLALGGLSDGTLFAQNVRLSLGNTKVNRDVSKTIADQGKHLFFPMYHNGITLICRQVDRTSDDTLSISDYVVVNGAQSLSVLYRQRAKISTDLRVIAKVIEIRGDEKIAKDITISSNNQNAIKPRDLRSTHILQTRLKAEFEDVDFEGYRYVIKRGERDDGNTINNEDAGRMLLAFDVREPWSCHQIYKVFDDKYGDIFGRPGVSAWRIILLSKIMARIERSLPAIGTKNEPLQKYRLTRYFLAYAIAKILDEDDQAKRCVAEPKETLSDGARLEGFLDGVEDLVRRLCVDVRFEFTEGDDPVDYKAALKSPVQVQEIEKNLRRSFLHDVAKGRDSIPGALPRSA